MAAIAITPSTSRGVLKGVGWTVVIFLSIVATVYVTRILRPERT